MRKSLLFLLFALTLTGSSAQQPEILFHRLGLKDGLFEEIVHTVQQDADGYIWINFRTLIQRYDGHRFINFYPGAQLPEGNVKGMAIDKKNRLWLLNGDATLGYLDPKSFVYHPVKVNIPPGYPPVANALFLNRDDQAMLLWLGQGFITTNTAAASADAMYNPFTPPKGWEPHHMWQDEDKNYWTGTAGGLFKYNAATKQQSYRGHNADNDAAIKAFADFHVINSVYTDSRKNVWVGSWEANRYRLHSVNLQTGRKVEWEKKVSTASGGIYYAAYGVTETAGNIIWLTGDNILCRINPDGETVEYIPNTSSGEYSIRYDLIISAYEDRDKNVWLSTNKGLFRFNPYAQLFSVIENRRREEKPAKISTTGILETSKGELYVSTWGGSVYAYDARFNPLASSGYIRKHIHEMAWCVVERPNGDIWCGMQAGSIYIIDALTRKIRNVVVPAAKGQTIRQMAVDKNGNVWLGTHNGEIVLWNAAADSFRLVTRLGGLVSRILVDTQNRVWAGTDRDGLYCINSASGEIIHHYTSQGEKGKRLYFPGLSDVLQYNDSIFYISGNGLSILNTNTGNIQFFTVADGLPSAGIASMVKDRNGYIWMATSSGIVSYHPQKRRLSHYDASDGVYNNTFSVGASAILRNGHIIFGTNQDLLLFNPDSLTQLRYLPPRVHISGIEIMGDDANVDSLLRLPVINLAYNQNAFRVFFSTLNYKDVHVVYYMLEGIDKDWKKAGKSNVVDYNYLPPGKYVLKATCLGEDGKPGEIISVSFRIAAPFYKTGWFYAGVILAIAAALFWLDRERLKRREALEKMRNNIATNLQQDVNTALQNINILSEMAKIKAGKDIDKSRDLIEQIHGKSHNMMIALDDMLWSIDPVNDSMDKTLLRMQEFIDALNNRYGSQVAMVVDEKVKKLRLDMQFRHDAFILFRESIRKIVAAGVKDCGVHMGYEKNILSFTVQCNNEDCDLQQLNNFLQSTEMDHHLSAIRATLHTEVHKSNTTLVVKIPV